MLDIVASYHRIQFQGNLMIQTQQNGKKPNFGTDLSPMGQKFFIKLVVKHYVV